LELQAHRREDHTALYRDAKLAHPVAHESQVSSEVLGRQKSGSLGQTRRAATLIVLAISGQSLIYLLTVMLARHLGVDGFEAYVVASTAFTLMISVSPQGLEKYALRLLPVLFERNDWERTHGFLRFGARRTFYTSVILALVVCAWVGLFSDYSRATKLAISASCLSLPGGALVHYYVEVLSATGREYLATALYRVAVPLITVVLATVLLYSPLPLSGGVAVACWGVAWVLVLAAFFRAVNQAVPASVWSASPVVEKPLWKQESRPFIGYRVVLALLANMAILALDRLQPSAISVGAYVAALSTANLALVLATSTNRFFGRRLSALLEQGDYNGILALRWNRLRWLVPLTVVFLALIFWMGHDILTFFRPEFPDEGLIALRLIAVATAVSILFSLAPTYLKYQRRNRTLTKIVAVAATTQAVLLLLLVPRFAATGAAIAYSVSMCMMYLLCAWVAYRGLAGLAIQSKQ